MGEPVTAAVRFLSGEREPTRVATTGNIVLQGLQVIDGVPLSVNDRVLVRDQTDARLNGIYTASRGRWFRSADASFPRAIAAGVTVRVQEGATYGGTSFVFENTIRWMGAEPIYVLPVGGAVIAAGLSFSPTATIFSTDVQAAIEEVDQNFRDLGRISDLI